jgi:hypothetical protein
VTNAVGVENGGNMTLEVTTAVTRRASAWHCAWLHTDKFFTATGIFVLCSRPCH